MPLITITHTIGCDATAIARRVAEGLNVELYDESRLAEEAQRAGLNPEQLERFRQEPPNWFERRFTDKPDIHLNLLESMIYEAAKRGEGVIIGHGSQMLLHDFACALHVFVTAQEDTRVSCLMSRQSLSEEGARKLIHHSDNRRRGFFRYAFQKDWDDPTLYDVCINTDKIGEERAVHLIVETARSPEIASCSIHALKALQRLSVQKRVEASLREMDLQYSALVVGMSDEGVVRVSGVVFDVEDKERIPATIGRLPGVEKVELDITTMPAGYD